MLVQQQVASIHGAMEKQTNALTIMENQLSQFGLSLLSGHDEKAIECKISAIDNSLMSELQWMRHADDPAEKQSFKNNIAALQFEQRELVKLLANASESTLKLLGPAPGTLFPPIAMIAAAVPAADLATATVALPATPIVPTIAVAQLQTPVVPLTPAVPQTPSEAVSQTPTIIPTTVTTAHIVPRTPTRTVSQAPTLTLTNTHHTTVSPHTHLTPLIPVFDLSSIQLSTPTPAPKAPTTKRTKPVNAFEIAAKRLRPLERTITTRSESKSTNTTRPTNVDQVTDLFNEDNVNEHMVCHHPIFASLPFLITIPADQGGRKLVGSRPFTTCSLISCLTSVKPAFNDQLGCVYTFKSFYYSTLCSFDFTKLIMPFLWAFSILFFLCLISPAGAAPTCCSHY